MAKINLGNPIYDAIENVTVDLEHRPYLGMSGLGGDCKREIWYTFRWAYKKQIPLRIKRLFERGDWEEERVIADMRDAGIIVDGQQMEAVAHFGHCKGHADGTAINIPGAEKTRHLLEIKTANDKRFKDMKKMGIKRAAPGYYAQAQLYMGQFNLKRTLFVITNKNDEMRHYERINFDEGEYNRLLTVALDILTTDVPPTKIGDVLFYKCKYCSAYEICQLGNRVQRNCRTCKYGTIVNGGKWTCGKDEEELSVDKQRVGCDDWTILESMI